MAAFRTHWKLTCQVADACMPIKQTAQKTAWVLPLSRQDMGTCLSVYQVSYKDTLCFAKMIPNWPRDRSFLPDSFKCGSDKQWLTWTWRLALGKVSQLTSLRSLTCPQRSKPHRTGAAGDKPQQFKTQKMLQSTIDEEEHLLKCITTHMHKMLTYSLLYFEILEQ